MNCLTPPAKGINVLAGLAQPPSRDAPLNNLNQVWLKMTQSLQKGSVMVCGGDFIGATQGCLLTDTTTNHGALTTTAKEAAGWNVNPDSNKVCSTPQELHDCKCGDTTNGDCKPDGSIKKGTLSQCICPCPAGEMKYPPGTDDSNLLQACIDAMKRGAKIVFLDDGNFLNHIYPGGKDTRDYECITLQNASNNLPLGGDGGFYWYFYAPPDAIGVVTHAKVCAAYHDTGTDKPWLSTILGSFNPSFPISLTFEMATVVVGYLSDPVMEMFGYVTFDVMTNIVNFQYSKNDVYIKGGVWDKNKKGGAAQGMCPSNMNSKYANHCTIPPSSSNDAFGFLQPWHNIGQSLKADMKQAAPWWTKLAKGPWKESYTGPMYGEKTFYQDGDIKTDVNFCGLKFCGDGIDKYGSTDEQRIIFTDKDVVVRVGMTPSARFPRFNYGLQLINELMADTKEYFKVGIMTSFADDPGEFATTVMDANWVLGPGYKLPKRDGYNSNVTTGQMLTLTRKGLPIYVMQKPDTQLVKEAPCAFECKDGTCSVSDVKSGPFENKNPYPHPTNTCYTIYGEPKTGSCAWGSPGFTSSTDYGNWNIASYCGAPGDDTKEACVCNSTASGKKRTPGVWTPSTAEMKPSCFDSLSTCKSVCEGDTKENYTKTRCDSRDVANWVGAISRSWPNGEIPDGTGRLVNWLHGRDKIGVMSHTGSVETPRTKFEVGMPPNLAPMSKLGNDQLNTVSPTNPYPIFYRWYKSGLHWKFYMNESSMIFSTQHPNHFFYSDSITGTTMGYDIRWSNCPGMIAYYDQLFNYVWKYDTIQLDGMDPAYPIAGGICYGAPTPSNSPQNGCASGLYFSKNPYLPPLCSGAAGDNCCDIPGSSNLDGACYPGGQGRAKNAGFKCEQKDGKYSCEEDNTNSPQYKTKDDCMAACKKKPGPGPSSKPGPNPKSPGPKPPGPKPPSPRPPSRGGSGGWPTGKKVLVGVGGAVAFVLIVVGLLYIFRPRMFIRR